MILQNKDGENKIFIDDSLIKHKNFTFNDNTITPIDKSTYALFTEEKISSGYLGKIEYNPNNDFLYLYDEIGSYMMERGISDDEIVSLSINFECDQNICIGITIMKIPAFLLADNDNKYPKFEVNLSDTFYAMKIYIDDHTYIDIPQFQSHIDIRSTLEYISQLIFYLTLDRPNFIQDICNLDKMDLLVYDSNHDKAIAGGSMEYKIGQDGLYLTGGELDNYLVEWHKFFKLVMDGSWEVDFYESPKNPHENKCGTCDNNTSPDEVDNGCYMCCKGFEDNYVPKK